MTTGEWQIVERGGTRDILGEGLLWSAREGAVYWTDILKPALHRLTLATGEVRSWAMPEMIGWVIERRDRPGLIAGLQSGFVTLSLDPLTIEPIADPEPDLPENRLNDAKADRWGRIWAGSMPVAIDKPSGALHCLHPDGRVTCVDRGYGVANGPAISPDHRWLYHTDTVAGEIYRFPLSADGLGTREAFIRFAEDWGAPDGMTVDDQGGLWVAHWGGWRLTRFTPGGEVDRTIALPTAQITNVCFAGEALDRLFVTSAALDRPDDPLAGSLFEVDAGGARGLLPEQFGG